MNAVTNIESLLWSVQSRISWRQALAVISAIIVLFALTPHMHRTAIAAVPDTVLKRFEIQQVRMSDEISVRAAGRGTPYINLSDGRELITAYSGPAELTQMLEANQARPLSLASADFDEDGVPDLISGYAAASGGMVSLLRGNVDALYPNTPEAQQRKANGSFTDAPFLSPALVFGVPEAADFLGAGDFDGDGHWDVVAAARGSRHLDLLSGDGKGNLRAAQRIELPGGLTALTVGEINRRDGLDDVIVAVNGDSGARVLVYEGPQGALRAKPEAFELAEEATALALGQLDDSYEMDLAVAAGHELMIVYGRDRKLSLDQAQQAQVRPASIDQRTFPSLITSIALGDFSGNHSSEIALLGGDGQLIMLSRAGLQESDVAGKKGRIKIEKWKSHVMADNGWAPTAKLIAARMSSMPVDNVVVTDLNHQGIELIINRAAELETESGQESRAAEQVFRAKLEAEREPEIVLPMRLNGDALNDLVILTNGRSAPTTVMTAAATTFIVTNTNDSGPGSLRQAVLNANANPGADLIQFSLPGGVGTIRLFSQLPDINEAVTIDGVMSSGNRVELDGTNAGSNALGIRLFAGNSRIRGMVINRFTNSGIVLDRNGNNVIDSNFIGTDPTGKLELGNLGNGINLLGGPNNVIGGTTNAAGNIVSANGFPGIFIGNSAQNLVQGNFVGTDITGKVALGNGDAGVVLGGVSGETQPIANNNTVGGTVAGSGNLISGNKGGNNGAGVSINNKDSNGNLVQRNFIGTDVTGTIAIANTSNGIQIRNGSLNTIGGTTSAAINLISGNSLPGVFIGEINATQNQVQGNFIGTDRSGTLPLGNSNGVKIDVAFRNTVGGAVQGSGNLISGNRFPGVALSGSNGTENQIQGNLIGTDLTGTAPLGNQGAGVLLGGFLVNQNNTPVIARDNTIGGTTAGTANLISGNIGPGITIVNFGCTGNVVLGNLIGTDTHGTRALPNQGNGVSIAQAPDNTIGPSNLISGNRDHGVSIGIRQQLDGGIVTGGTGITVRGNLIGTNINGTGPLGNGLNGVFVDADSVSNTIENNLIAYNGRNGICIPSNNNPGLKIQMIANLILSNAAIGIDLGLPGVTPNDDRDLDQGANTLQNFPTLNSANTLLSSKRINGVVVPTAVTTVRGVFNSTPNQTFTLEFFFGSNVDSSGHQLIGTLPIPLRPLIQVTTDSNGNAPFAFTFEIPGGASSGWVNSTATDSARNTSELSQCIAVGQVVPAGPRITSVVKDRKALVVTGSGFVDGAQLYINDQKQKKVFVDSSTSLTAKKAGNIIQPGDRVQVINPNGAPSNVQVYQP
ncbi:MAG TPA: hypothetical protein VJ464_13585 [Blastocatellia bacterium]|nr:hypothetical protein [Blastocatellia bacterium]